MRRVRSRVKAFLYEFWSWVKQSKTGEKVSVLGELKYGEIDWEKLSKLFVDLCMLIFLGFCAGREKHWLGVWRRQHWIDGSRFSSCLWGWTPRVRVPTCSLSLSLSLSLCLSLYVHILKTFFVFVFGRVIPKTLMPREVCNWFACIGLGFCNFKIRST